MRKTVYQHLSETLLDMVDIKHVDLWNNNLAYLNEEQPFYTPAVFIEFAPIQWHHRLQGVREAVLAVTLHVVTQRNSPTAGQYETTALEFFDLLDQINAKLHGLAGPGFDALTAITSTTDHDFDELIHSIEIYQTHIVDTSACIPPKTFRPTNLSITLS